LPIRCVIRLVEQEAGQLIVPVGENVGLDTDTVAHGPFHGKAPGVHLRLHVLDDDAASI